MFKMVHMWTSNINANLINGVVLLDLRKAFDLVNHEALIRKLSAYQCSQAALNWFESYLTSRNQKVVFKGHTSIPLPVQTGVPQGSILGPLLFILFINDLPLHMSHSQVDMYADDSTLTVSGDCLVDISEGLNSDLETARHWCDVNKMAINQ